MHSLTYQPSTRTMIDLDQLMLHDLYFNRDWQTGLNVSTFKRC